MSDFWHGRRVLITGGASFIGSHLTDALVAAGAKARVVDDLSTGRFSDISRLVGSGVEFVNADLRDQDACAAAMDGIDTCFHLAARHGGRGFVDRQQAACVDNFLIDGSVFRAAVHACAKCVYASSGCAYPMFLQRDAAADVRLREDQVGPPYDPDNVYGHAKLVGEVSLRALRADRGMRAAVGRFFTVYGPRGYESHAVTAIIARAFIAQDPFVVWGTGDQVRNWTHVSDIVRGLLLLGERVDDATAVNLGTTERVRVIDAVLATIAHVRERHYPGYAPRIEFRPAAPTGPVNRVADNTLAASLLGWAPQVLFHDGLRDMIGWYFANREVAAVRKIMACEG